MSQALNQNIFYFSKSNPSAFTPEKATPFAAGFDLKSVETTTVLPNTRKLVDTGLVLNIPHDFYGRIAPRSGLSLKGIDIGAGVIDSDYRGNVKILVINNGEENFDITRGNKIAQLIIEKIYVDAVIEISINDMTNTVRGSSGFGSTGI